MEQTIMIIGLVHSSLKNIGDCPLQEDEDAPGATIEIFPAFGEGIKDIQIGSTILLLTWLHKADRNVIKCVSRNNYDSTLFGVFSTRSPDRPNPIGLHTVKVLAIDNNGFLKVAALEVLDQTPLIDIKPVWN